MNRRFLVGALLIATLACSRGLEDLIDVSEFNCADGLQNGEETDVDCGGSACEPCPAFFFCTDGPDCQSGICDAGICAPPSCDDGLQNGDESDVDCGDDCPPCADGLLCGENEDCESDLCLIETNTCATLYEGELILFDFVPSDANATLDILQSHDVIAGDVNINDVDATATVIPPLQVREIRGSLNIIGNSTLESLSGLGSIELIEGDLSIRANSSLVDLEGLAVREVQGTVEIQQNRRLERLNGLERLSFADRGLVITDNISLTDLSALDGDDNNEGLTEVGQLRIENNLALESIDAFNALVVAGDIRIADNDALLTLGEAGATAFPIFPQLAAAGEIAIRDNRRLTTVVAFGSLATAERIEIAFNQSLTSLTGFLELLSLDNGLLISNNPSLATVSGFDFLSVVFGGMTFQNLPALQALPDFTQLGIIAGITGLTFEATGTDYATVTGFPNLDFVTALTIKNTQIERIVGMGGRFIVEERLSISNNPALQQLGGAGGNLGAIDPRGTVYIFNNPVLSSIALANLTNLRETLTVANLPLLSSLSLPNFSQARGLRMGQLASLLAVDVPVEAVVGSRPGLDNSGSFEFFKELDVVGIFLQSSGPALYDFSRLDAVSNIVVSGAGLSVLTDALTRVDGDLRYVDTDQPVSAPLLATLGDPDPATGPAALNGVCELPLLGSLCIENASFDSLELPELERMSGVLLIEQTEFSALNAPKLSTVGAIRVSNSSLPLDVDLSGLMSVDDPSGLYSPNIQLAPMVGVCDVNFGACQSACLPSGSNACAPDGCTVVPAAVCP